jgi:hypothetical protein
MNKAGLNKSFLTVSLLGKALKLNIKYKNNSNIELSKKQNELHLVLPTFYKKADKITVINSAIQKLYFEVASTELENSMEIARHILQFAPEDYSIQPIENAFYKCLKSNVLLIDPSIVKYNSNIITTTIIQAFCKIKCKKNAALYKATLFDALKKYEGYKINNNSITFMQKAI